MADRLSPGEKLASGQNITSADGRFSLIFQGDSNLVLYRNGVGAMWDATTRGTSADRVIMQGDGNLVLYRAGTAIWASGTNGFANATLVVQTDGNLVIYSKDNVAIWNSGTNANLWRLNSGHQLQKGESLRSLDGRFELILQTDGNLVLYRIGSGPIWDSRTAGAIVNNAVMQGDGNFVVYGPSGAIWNSQTENNPGAYITLQNDGNLVIYRDGKAIWNTKADVERMFFQEFLGFAEYVMAQACLECGIQVGVGGAVGGAVGSPAGVTGAIFGASLAAAVSTDCRKCLFDSLRRAQLAMEEAAARVAEEIEKQRKLKEAREAREYLDRIDRSNYDCERWERNRGTAIA